MPAVSVLMAVHNGAQYLPEAIRSILGQSFVDFEFLIIDDGSTDESRSVIKSFSDPRISLVANQRQQGLTKSLNQGLDMAQGKYVARMDHDDIAMRERLAQQVSFLDRYRDIDVLGTWARTLGREPEQTWRYPTEDAEIRSEFLFNSTLVHSSVMLRKASFDRLGLRYDAQVSRAQDYELWTRAAGQHLRFANIGKVLMRYRIHEGQVGQREIAKQQATADRVREQQLEALGLHPSHAELAIHHDISRWQLPRGRDELLALEQWLATLRAVNLQSNTYPEGALDRVLARRWWAACKANVGLGMEARRLAGRYGAGITLIEKAKFWTKAAMRQFGVRR